MAMPGTETIRFRRPTTGPNAPQPKKDDKDKFGSMAPGQAWKRRHQGLLQDQVGRQTSGPMVPSLSLALRLLLLVRVSAAMYAIITDCDEVFNFFEPLHYFQYNNGFQTWELSPQFAIRSWAYVLLHWPLAHLGPLVLRLGKRQAFFALRIFLGVICSYCEARFYRAVVETINARVGRYLLFMLAFSAGMWQASIAFLPSSFAMYTTMFATSLWLHPASSEPQGRLRAVRTYVLYALGAVVGWPFSAALAVPFVLEQVVLNGADVALGADRSVLLAKRWKTLMSGALNASLIPVYAIMIDSWAYGRLVFPTLNIVAYNIFSSSGGPDLYGAEPWYYYILNLGLNFNYFAVFALLSLPALAITYVFDFKRLGKTQVKPKPGETSPYTLLIMRLAPFYIWFGILSAQAHKEERFMYPAYPLLCLNAAVTIYLVRGWCETYYIHLTRSPYNASRSTIFSNITLFAVFFPCVLSISRIAGMHMFYHAPFDILHHFQYQTVPSILSEMGYRPLPPHKNWTPYKDEAPPEVWDLSPLQALDPPIRLCYGTEWYRFPGSYLVPEGIEVAWLRTEFDGMMPRHWEPSTNATGKWPREETRITHPGRFNGQNKPSGETGTYVLPRECNYIVALSLPSVDPSPVEPDWTTHKNYEKEHCEKFLDAKSTPVWARLGWLPAGLLEDARVYGQYCLMKRK